MSKIFESFFDPVFIVDQNWIILNTNSAGSSWADMSPKRIEGKLGLNQVFNFTPNLTEHIHLLNTTEPTPYIEFQLAGRQKKARVQLSAQQLNEGQWLVYFRDVTLEETLQGKYQEQLKEKEVFIEELQKAKSQLEVYSENLESLVQERTAEIQKLNQTLKALINSLGQAFFVFNKNGDVLDFSSAACDRILEGRPNGKSVIEVLKVLPGESSAFNKWIQILFDEMLPFKDLADLGPNIFEHSQGLHIDLSYFPIRGDDEKLTGVVVVATDSTELIAAKAEAESQKNQAQFILTAVEHTAQVNRFIKEGELIAQNILKQMSSPIEFNQLFRDLHTLKGGSASFHASELAKLCHEAEGILETYKQVPSKMQTELHQYHLKPLSEKIFSELTVFKNRVIELNSNRAPDQLMQRVVPLSTLFELGKNNHNLIEPILLVPISESIKYLNLVAKETAQITGKKIKDIEFIGGNICIYPEFYQKVFGSLVHFIRNCVDHGIETPEQRKNLGKDPSGKIKFEVSKDTQLLNIKISDDGAGVDLDKIRQKLNEKNARIYSDQEIHQILLNGGISSVDSVTSISGRGVGMESIQNEVKAINGSIIFSSQSGQGSQLSLSLPYLQSMNEISKYSQAA